MNKFIDLTNKKFGKWTVLKRGSNSSDGHIMWICECECGSIKQILGKTLKNGSSKGCHHCQLTKHGFSRTNTYKIWQGIKRRCNNPNFNEKKWYGEKRITLCDKWNKSFINFLEDMGERPNGKSIDRIDNSKGYYKENCRWATNIEQCLNKESSIRIGSIFNGWKLIHRNPSPSLKGLFECIYCGRQIEYRVSAVKSGYKKACLCQI